MMESVSTAMTEDQNLLVENIREALRAYERFLVLSIFSSALVLAYSFDKPGALVSIGYGQIRIEFAFFAAVILYFFFSSAACYALKRAAENARLVTAPEKRATLGLLPSMATDHRSSFRVLMLAVAPLLILAAFTTEFVQSTEPLSQRPLVGYIGFGLFVVFTACAVWEKLRDFEKAIAHPSPGVPNDRPVA
jgi:hypothetical protein